MAQENATKFYELLKSDEALQAKIREATAAYDGAKDDEKAVFEAVIAPLAAEAGLPFTYEEGFAFATAERNLTDEELDAVAGGRHFCYFVGGSSKPEDWDWYDGGTGGACAYVGVTF